jgi:cytidine deaminase
MLLTKKDIRLIKKAKSLVAEKAIRGGFVKEVGCVLVTEKGKIFVGVNLDLACGIGFCAEHTAIAQMVTKTDETHVKTIVSAKQDKVMPPCGRCRELLNLMDARNVDTEVIVEHNKKVRLEELLPYSWEVTDKSKCKVW